VAVSPEEVALSLEAEMFRTLAGTAEVESVSAAPAAPDPVSPAVVESATAVEVKAEVPAETTVADPAPASAEVAPNVEAVQDEHKDLPAKAAEDVAEEPAAATFADAVQQDEIKAVSAQSSADPVSAAAVPAEEVVSPADEAMGVTTSEAVAEGEDEMAKERAKTGKSNWHQLRTGSAVPGTQDVVEAAKQAEPGEEAPKAMAAAAAAESAPAPSAATGPDPSAIASIVDSVLADLRPKIVEEIAKKLAGK
jgi:hypothetical protein